MRLSSIISEAWRNLVSGTSRAALFAIVFIATVGLVALLDVRTVVTIVAGAKQYATSGAAVQALRADGLVDGHRCDQLAGTGSIVAAGALRQGTPVRLWALPGSTIQTIQATPGLLALLPVIAQPAQAGATPGGVWLSADLAGMLGVSPGAIIQTSGGPATVAGVYTWPDDQRARDLGYVMITPIPADGVFTQCWTQIWPPDPDTSALIYMTITATSPNNQISVGQLNTSLGVNYDASALLAGRLTGRAPWVGALAGLALGYVAARTRRLEIASNLHARAPRPHLGLQFALETAAWALAAAVITAAALLWAARTGNPDPSDATWYIGLRTITAGVAATLIGTILAVVTTAEKHLFKYTKDR